MSASNKKKLRKEANAAQLTQKQLQEQKEAKKLRNITVSFVAIMLVVALTATSILAVRGINNSGIIDKNTIAAVTGEHQLDSIQINYYYTDYIRNMYQQWKTSYGDNLTMYLGMMGLDVNAPLNEQKTATDSDETWAEHYLTEALEQAKNDYALYDKAMADKDFQLTDEEKQSIEYASQMMEIYAMYGGFKNSNKYIKAIYGAGANVDTYQKYVEVSTTAAAYYNHYRDALTYNDAAIREHEKDKYVDYSSFSYALYPVNVSDYLTGGTKDAEGKTTYSDDEKAAAQKKAEETANILAASSDIEMLDKAIAALEVNAGKTNAASTKNTLVKYTQLPADYQSWLASADRKAGDLTVIVNDTKTTDAEGKETTTVNGYYVLGFMERDDNLRPLANVRHLLVKFEGGTTDSNGNKTYSDAEKATAKAEAERLLQEWKDGNATEDTFVELVKKHSDDGSAENGGLFEDIHRESSYVDSFRNWCVDANRKVGDTEVIESEYGYHVMYYSSDDAMTFRDYLITEDLRAADLEKWYNAIVEPATITLKKTNRLNLDLAIANIAS